MDYRFALIVIITLAIGYVQFAMVRQINQTGIYPKMRVLGTGLKEYFLVFKLHRKSYPKSWLRVMSVALTVIGWLIWGSIFYMDRKR
jgi:hypothetical protein